MEAEVIPVLRVADAAVAIAWYERLGFAKQWEHRFGPGMPAFVSVARDRTRLFLSEHQGDARPDTLVHLMVSDVDAVVAEFGRPANLRTGASSSFATRTVTGCGSANLRAEWISQSSATGCHSPGSANSRRCMRPWPFRNPELSDFC